jgi:hypothetical protein
VSINLASSEEWTGKKESKKKKKKNDEMGKRRWG